MENLKYKEGDKVMGVGTSIDYPVGGVIERIETIEEIQYYLINDIGRGTLLIPTSVELIPLNREKYDVACQLIVQSNKMKEWAIKYLKGEW